MKPKRPLVRHFRRMRSVLLVALVGCAGVSAAPSPVPAPPTPSLIPLGSPHVVPGETMVYEIKFRGLPVARVAVAVGKPGWVEGRPAVIVKSRGQTDGIIALIGEIDWAMETTIDLETG